MGPVLRRPVLLLGIICIVAPVTAGAAPHTRLGWCVGVGFGIESVSWTGTDGGRDTENSGTANARVGRALKDDLVVGIEFWSWAKEYEVQLTEAIVPVDVRLTATTISTTYFPGGGGFFIRMAAGLAYGRLQVAPPSQVTTIPAIDDNETGLAALLAPGYEWRFTQRFALGAQGDVVYLGLGNVLKNAFGYGVNAQFNWYW
jgi:hypothetical protein